MRSAGWIEPRCRRFHRCSSTGRRGGRICGPPATSETFGTPAFLVLLDSWSADFTRELGRHRPRSDANAPAGTDHGGYSDAPERSTPRCRFVRPYRVAVSRSCRTAPPARRPPRSTCCCPRSRMVLMPRPASNALSSASVTPASADGGAARISSRDEFSYALSSALSDPPRRPCGDPLLGPLVSRPCPTRVGHGPRFGNPGERSSNSIRGSAGSGPTLEGDDLSRPCRDHPGAAGSGRRRVRRR